MYLHKVIRRKNIEAAGKNAENRNLYKYIKNTDSRTTQCRVWYLQKILKLDYGYEWLKPK